MLLLWVYRSRAHESGKSTFELVSHYRAIDCTIFGLVTNFNQTQLRCLRTFDLPFTITSGTDHDSYFCDQSRYVVSQIKNATGSYLSGRSSREDSTTYPLMVVSGSILRSQRCGRDTASLMMLLEVANWGLASARFDTISTRMPGADLGTLQDNNNSSELVQH